MKKKIFQCITIFLAAAAFTFVMKPAEVKAADNIASGVSGDLTWVIDADGKLTITGEGDYERAYYAGQDLYVPAWCEYADDITSAEADVSGITSTAYMFYECINLISVDVSGLDTGSVTDMEDMFSGCDCLMSVDVSGFDTGSVTDMRGMFSGCYELTDLDVSGFDTSSVTDMRGMFYECERLTYLDTDRFDTGSVTNMSYMFDGCHELSASITLSGDIKEYSSAFNCAACADDARIVVYHDGDCSKEKAEAVVDTNGEDWDCHVYLYDDLTAAEPVITLSRVSSGIKITLTDTDWAEGFQIFRKGSDGTYTRIKTLTGHDTLIYTDKDVKNGSRYSYKVRCFLKASDGTRIYSRYSSVKSSCFLSRPVISKVSSKPKTLTLKWNKNSKVSGYQIQVAADNSFAGSKKTVAASKSATSADVSGLKSGKTYYVRIRGYKTVDGIRYYSTWSSEKQIKIK